MKSTISTFELFNLFCDETAAWLYLKGRLWSNRVKCPKCGSDERIIRNFWQRFHHCAHPCLGLSNGALWAWRLHDWTWHKGWDPEHKETLPKRWKGLG